MGAKKSEEDKTRAIFGKTAAEIFAEPSHDSKQDHAKFHSANAFCGFAGPEEMKHYHLLMDALSDDQVAQLAKNVGISFMGGHFPDDRDTLISVIEETDRESFYREYYRIIKPTKPKKNS